MMCSTFLLELCDFKKEVDTSLSFICIAEILKLEYDE